MSFEPGYRKKHYKRVPTAPAELFTMLLYGLPLVLGVMGLIYFVGKKRSRIEAKEREEQRVRLRIAFEKKGGRRRSLEVQKSDSSSIRPRRTVMTDRIASLLQGMLIVLVLGVGVYLVWGRHNNSEFLDIGNNQLEDRADIFADFFKDKPSSVIDRLGVPDLSRDLRENERLMFWYYKSVALQIHTKGQRISRVAYSTDNTALLIGFYNQFIARYGGEAQWEKRYSFGDITIMVNRKWKRTLVEKGDTVLLYDYVLSNQEPWGEL